MKTIKRICTLLLAVMLIASFSVNAFAEDEPAAEGDTNTPAEEGAKAVPDTDGTRSVTAENSKEVTGVFVSGPMVHVDPSGENNYVKYGTTYTDLTGGGSVTVTAASEDKPFTVSIDGDIIYSDGNALNVQSHGRGPISVETTGDVTSTANNPSCSGINAFASGGNNSSVSIKTNGDTRGYNGVHAQGGYASGAGDTSLETHDIISTDGYGIQAYAFYSGSVTITADSVNAGGTGIEVYTNYGSTDKVSTVDITVKENVSGTTGIIVDDYSTSSFGHATITVGTKDNPDSGTVKGDIVLDDLVTGDTVNKDGTTTKGNTTITLWKVDGDITGTHSADVINYFVRQAALKAEDGSISDVTVENKTSDTAKVEQTISFKVNPAGNNKVDKVTFIDGGEALTPDSNGVYTFKAPKFGGIMLNATFKQDTPVKPDPTPTPAAPAVAATCKLTFDLGGGTIDGKSEYSKTYSYGQHIKLPIPEKEGYTFGGWEATVRGKTVSYEGGARYTVTAAKTFTAIWIEN